MLRPPFKLRLKNWWPVAAWLVVIRLESTNYASSGNTLTLLYRISTMIFGRVNVRMLAEINEVLRKSGHFIGYAILSALVFLALRQTYRDRMKPLLQRDWGIYLRDRWQFDWALIAVLFTLVTAAWDEIHQTFLSSRTGRWQDVAIDTSGAIFMQVLLYAHAAYAMKRTRQASIEEREPSLTR